MEPARPARLRRRQRERPARPAGGWRDAARGARPCRPQRLPLRPRPQHRAGALGRSVRARDDVDRRRSADRRAQVQPGQGGAHRHRDAQHLPRLPRGQGLATDGVVAAHAAALHPAPEPVPGRAAVRGELHRRHALRRHGREHLPRAGRQPRPLHRVGSGRTQGRLAAEGELPGLERRARHRRRRRLLRHHGRRVQGRRRKERRDALAVQDELGGDRPAGQLPRPRRQAVRRRLRRCRRLGRHDRQRPGRPTRSLGRARLRQRDEGPAAAHEGGRDALCLHAAL